MGKRVRTYWMKSCGRLHLIPCLTIAIENNYTEDDFFNKNIILAIELYVFHRWCAVEVVLYKNKEVHHG